MKTIKKLIMVDLKEYLDEGFDKWEIWTYFVILPLGFIVSGLIGYVLGTI